MAEGQTAQKPEHAKAQPLTPARKGSVLEQLRARQKERGKTPGVTHQPNPKPAAPPKVLSPAELKPPPPQPPPDVTAPPPPEEGTILEMLFAKAAESMRSTPPKDDVGVAMMQALAHQVQNQQPVKVIEDVVVPHLGEMSSKLTLWRNVAAYHDMFERAPMWLLMRWTMEKGLCDDLINQKLTPAEKLALLAVAIKEHDKIESKLGDYHHSLEKSGKGTQAEIETAAEKVDRAQVKTDDPGAKDLIGTSAVGRELARRLLQKAGQASERLVAEALDAKKSA